jgi:hypothetical protein
MRRNRRIFTKKEFKKISKKNKENAKKNKFKINIFSNLGRKLEEKEIETVFINHM